MEHKREEIIVHEITQYDQGYEQGQSDMWATVEKRLPEIVGNAMDDRLQRLQVQEQSYQQVKFWLVVQSLFITGGLFYHIIELTKGWKR